MKIKNTLSKDKQIVTVKPSGRVDINNSQQLLDKLNALADKHNEIILDASEIEYISSAGLRVFLSVYRNMRKKHGSFKLINVNDTVQDILEVTGFDIIFEYAIIGDKPKPPIDVKKKLTDKGQEHLLRFYDELDLKGREKLCGQIEALDLSILDNKETQIIRGRFEPLGAMTKERIDKDRERLTQIGLDAIRQGKVGAVLLAGGQGSRLGSKDPKGMFNIGVNKTLYIFECLIDRLMSVTEQAGAFLPLFIMTSSGNDKQTREFFEQQNYFGYDKNYIHFFVQEQLPTVDLNGKLMLSAKDTIACAPNGNGGWYASMQRTGVLHATKDAKNIEWLNVFAVDNVLQRIADPCFIGAVIDTGSGCGAKVVTKASPDENVGVLCLEDGKPSVVEYYELTDEMRTRREEDGSLSYKYGVILNYLFKADELDKAYDTSLPLHKAFKKVDYINESGELIHPDEPNAYKFETLVLDMIGQQSSCLAFEVEREKEFAPVKNKTGIDSVESARELMIRNGIEL